MRESDSEVAEGGGNVFRDPGDPRAATPVRAEDESDGPEQLRAWTTFPERTTDHPGREYLDIAPRRGNEPSPAIRNVITGACCGWAEPPTAGEAERAIRGREATDRNFCIATTIIGESEIVDVMRAEAEGAYTFQDLAWWIHEIGPPYRQDLVHWLNAVIEPVPCRGTVGGPPPSRRSTG